MTDSLALKTYAKINLSLDVTGRREDGYHLVRMVMQSINLYDNMRVRLTEEPGIRLKCNKYYVPVDSRNTAYKAAEIMMEDFPEAFADRGVRIDIKKTIPVAAGLAGGSSNAAGVIIALNEMLGLGMDLDDMCRKGVRVGADVPFCLMTLAADRRRRMEGGSTCALAEGIGEELTGLRSLKMWCVVVKPRLSVSTAEIYRDLDHVGTYSHPDTDRLLEGLREGNIHIVQEGMGNVLENVTAVKYPEVETVKKIMMKYNKEMTMMSGSGPTVFSLFPGKRRAVAAYSRLRSELEDLLPGAAVFMARTL